MTAPRRIKQLACTCPVCGECWLVQRTGRRHRRCPACHFSAPAQAFAHSRLEEDTEDRALGTVAENPDRPGSAQSGDAAASSEDTPPRPTLGERLKRIIG